MGKQQRDYDQELRSVLRVAAANNYLIPSTFSIHEQIEVERPVAYWAEDHSCCEEAEDANA